MDIYISFKDFYLGSVYLPRNKTKTPWGSFKTAGISDSKAILRDLGMKAWNGRSHGLNLKPEREREREVYIIYA